MSSTNQYISLFLEESREQLQELSNLLLQLEKNPSHLDTINAIFRIAHTLKGMSAAMGFEGFKELTHHMEDLFGVFKEGTVEISSDDLDLLLACLDALSGDIEKIEGETYDNSPHPDLCKQLEERLAQNTAGKSAGKAAASKATPSPEKSTGVVNEGYSSELVDWIEGVSKKASLNKDDALLHVHVGFKQGTEFAGVRAYMVQDLLAKGDSEILGAQPDLESEEQVTEFHWILSCNASNFSELEKHVREVPDVESVAFNILGAGTDEPVVDAKVSDAASTSGEPEQASSSQSKTVRISMDRIDTLVNLVGELVVDRTRLDQYAHENDSMELATLVNSIGGVTNELQELVMQFRMEPIERMFSRFPRVVRDISKSLDKSVELVLTGQDTEVDRVVNEELAGALIHLIRNSLDHGIETIEERKKKGKPEKGTLELAATNQGDSIIITIRDDGRGIDPQKVLAKAIEKNLLTQEQAGQLSEREIYQLIFMSGFSTAEKTTDLSGRGVGMDVVKASVNKLGGEIQVFSTKDEGSRIVITLPTNMAIIDVLLVRINDDTYALPLATIQEVIACEQTDLRPVQNIEMLMVRGDALPLIRLPLLLGNDNPAETLTRKPSAHEEILVVIVSVQDQKYSLQVNKLIGMQEAVVKALPKQVAGNKSFSGAMILGNGEVALILNPTHLVYESRTRLDKMKTGQKNAVSKKAEAPVKKVKPAPKV